VQDCATLSDFKAVSDPPEWLDPADRVQLQEFLANQPDTERLGRYRFRIGSRNVDFTPAIDGPPSLYAI
jgi:alpha-galactosidase